MKGRFLALWTVCALAVGAFGLVGLLPSGEAPPAVVSTASAPPEQAGTLAFFGDSSDPWCRPAMEALPAWAKEQGWGLITYDCKGNPTIRGGQVDDLVRVERADVAVLCGMNDHADKTSWSKALRRAGLRVITLSPHGVEPDEAVDCALSAAEGQPYLAAGQWLGQGAAVVLLADLPDDPAVEQAREVLERQGVTVLDYGACWSTPQFAQDYAAIAMERWPELDGVVAFGRQGGLGAKAALGDRGKVLCLCWEEAMEAELADRRLDAAVEVSGEGILDALSQALQNPEAPPSHLETVVRTPPAA